MATQNENERNMDVWNFTKTYHMETFHSKNGEADPKIKGFFYLFMVKPDLNIGNMEIFNDVVNVNSFNKYSNEDQLKKHFRGLLNELIIENLTHDGKNYFSSIISNKGESITYPEIGFNNEDTLTTLDKAIFKLPITETGTSGMTFQIRFRENEGHDVLRMMSVWQKYINAVTKGNLSPKAEYVEWNIIDYKASLYVIHVKPDGKTITMWSKYTGIYPTGIPLSTYGEEISQIQDVTVDIEFSYDKFEWMNEDLLREMNLLTSGLTIDRVNMFKAGTGADIMSNSNIIPLITQIENSPFYYIDLNGLSTLAESTEDFKRTAAYNLFGARYTDSYIAFPAPMSEQMLDACLSYSFSKPNNTDMKRVNDKRSVRN